MVTGYDSKKHVMYEARKELQSNVMTPSLADSNASSSGNDKSMDIIAFTIPISVVTTVIVAIRLYARGTITRRFQVDDGIITAACICVWISNVAAFFAISAGHGQHTTNLTDDQKRRIMLWLMVGFAFEILSFSLPKLAIIFLICKMLRPSNFQRAFIWSLGLVNFSLLCGDSLTIVIACSDVVTSKPPLPVPDSCIPYQGVQYAQGTGVISAATNAYLAGYIALEVHKLGLARRRIVAMTVSAILCVFIEANVIIIAACVPAIEPLVTNFSSRLRSPSLLPFSTFKMLPPTSKIDTDAETDTVGSNPQCIEVERIIEVSYTHARLYGGMLLPEEPDTCHVSKKMDSDGRVTTVVKVVTSTKNQAGGIYEG